jgi:hypothetical protein
MVISSLYGLGILIIIITIIIAWCITDTIKKRYYDSLYRLIYTFLIFALSILITSIFNNQNITNILMHLSVVMIGCIMGWFLFLIIYKRKPKMPSWARKLDMHFTFVSITILAILFTWAMLSSVTIGNGDDRISHISIVGTTTLFYTFLIMSYNIDNNSHHN